MNLLKRIKRLCIKRNISIARLEQDTGLANGSIRKWGKTLPSSDRLQKVADYFNVTTDYLLGRSTSCIIIERLEELNLTIAQLSKETNIPEKYIINVDSIIPELWDYDNMEKIANFLNIDPSILCSALARQEPPIYDRPSTTAVEDFKDVINNTPSKYPPITDVKEAMKVILAQPGLMLNGEALSDESKIALANAINMGLAYAEQKQREEETKKKDKK